MFFKIIEEWDGIKSNIMQEVLTDTSVQKEYREINFAYTGIYSMEREVCLASISDSSPFPPLTKLKIRKSNGSPLSLTSPFAHLTCFFPAKATKSNGLRLCGALHSTSLSFTCASAKECLLFLPSYLLNLGVSFITFMSKPNQNFFCFQLRKQKFEIKLELSY